MRTDPPGHAGNVLGLAPGSSSQEVRRAFRAKARDLHPDLGGDPERFHALHLAYQALTQALFGPAMDPGMRRRRARSLDAGDEGIMVAEPNGEVIPEEEVMEGEEEAVAMAIVDILEGGLLKLDMGIIQEGIVGGVENMVENILGSIRDGGKLNTVFKGKVIIGENMKAILGENMKGGPQNVLKGVLRVLMEVDRRAWGHIRETGKVVRTVVKAKVLGIAEDILSMEGVMLLGEARGILEKGRKKVELKQVVIFLVIQFLPEAKVRNLVVIFLAIQFLLEAKVRNPEKVKDMGQRTGEDRSRGNWR
ncbi:unnamed protein product [Effrenium voratum]|nr:unnamed protein product [Effrenium voratum]